MSITVDTVTSALAQINHPLVSIRRLRKHLRHGGLHHTKKEIQSVVLCNHDIIVWHSDFLVTLIVEVLLQGPQCLGDNCVACAVRQMAGLSDTGLAPCQKHVLAPGLAATILEDAMVAAMAPDPDDPSLVGEDFHVAYGMGLIHPELLYFLVSQLLRYMHTDIVLDQKAMFKQTQMVITLLDRSITHLFTASAAFVKTTGLGGFYHLVPALTLKSPHGHWMCNHPERPAITLNWSAPIVEFTVQAPAQETALAMLFHTNFHSIVYDYSDLDGLMMVHPIHFLSRSIVEGWGIQIIHDRNKPLMVSVHTVPGLQKHGYRYPDQMQIIDSITIGTRYSAEKLSDASVSVTQWSLTCQECQRPTWDQLTNRTAGCASHCLFRQSRVLQGV